MGNDQQGETNWKKAGIAALFLGVAGAFVFVIDKLLGIEGDTPGEKLARFEMVVLSLISFPILLEHVERVYHMLTGHTSSEPPPPPPLPTGAVGWKWPPPQRTSHSVSFRNLFYLLLGFAGSAAIYFQIVA